MDYFGDEAKHFHMVPFTYEAHSAFCLEDPCNGMDFALLLLNKLDVAAFLKNRLVPITRENWINQSDLTFDFYRMLGIPKDEVYPESDPNSVRVRQTMIAVDRMAVENIGEPPPGVTAPTNAWFVGRLAPEAMIKNIEGMSGGPIYGFRRDDAGNLRYHVVALQSRWWKHNRTVFGCSVPAFAEMVHRHMESIHESDSSGRAASS